MGAESAQWMSAAAAAGVFVVGVVVGAFLGRLRGGAARRLRELASELEELRDEYFAYRGRVNEHFTRASDILGQITTGYAALYQHMAGAAEQLCGERLLRIDPRELGERLLPVASANARAGVAEPERRTEAQSRGEAQAEVAGDPSAKPPGLGSGEP